MIQERFRRMAANYMVNSARLMFSPEALAGVFQSIHAQGVADGVERYAWRADGELLVGTSGRSLREALADIQKEFS